MLGTTTRIKEELEKLNIKRNKKLRVLLLGRLKI
jgi:hypothetical protein